MTNAIKRSATNLSMAATALLCTMMQFGIINIVYQHTGKKMPKWLALSIKYASALSKVSTLIALFCPVATWIKVVLVGLTLVGD